MFSLFHFFFHFFFLLIISLFFCVFFLLFFFFFSSRRRHTRYIGDWSSDVCSSDLVFFVLIHVRLVHYACTCVGRESRFLPPGSRLQICLWVLRKEAVSEP